MNGTPRAGHDCAIWEMKPGLDAGSWGRSSVSVLSLNSHGIPRPFHKSGLQPSQDPSLLPPPSLPHAIPPKPWLKTWAPLLISSPSHRTGDSALGHQDDRNSSQCLPGWVDICGSLPWPFIPHHTGEEDSLVTDTDSFGACFFVGHL